MPTNFHPLRALAHHVDPLLAAGIHAALAKAADIEAVTLADPSSHADPDVVVCDYESGIELARQRRLPSSATRKPPGVLVVTWRDSEADVRAALQLGVGGYLLGNCALDELAEAVRVVGRGSRFLCEVAATRVAQSLGRTPLTLRESEVLQQMARGLPNKLIASELDIALGTVKTHTRSILDKLGARSRTQATVLAAHRGLLGPSSPVRPTAVPQPQRTWVRHSPQYPTRTPVVV